MGIKVEDLMAHNVVSLRSADTVAMARDVMKNNDIHAIVVTSRENRPLGILTSSDLMEGHGDDEPIAVAMREQVHSISRGADLSEAAQQMQKLHAHHIVVTDNKQVVGMLSSFDFLKLLDESRFAVRAV